MKIVTFLGCKKEPDFSDIKFWPWILEKLDFMTWKNVVECSSMICKLVLERLKFYVYKKYNIFAYDEEFLFEFQNSLIFI